MTDLVKLVQEAINTSYENGYGAETEAHTDESLARELSDFDADFVIYSYDDILAAVREVRKKQ